ncbi:hypothetical protein CWE08_11190 [Aliidiomarina iranensis]|uniref:Sel1 repeat family protein n=1 Tax=Aliidiomarina iranensis TaxID=1434071 RepID=A0A432VQM5_9GAMM|nr:tetratricopeptide repeat protein [Aliidiomarina iranensis]RUO18477.1 hypothetical protein CWE08_11190 [Aliidiomarina iranensis]
MLKKAKIASPIIAGLFLLSMPVSATLAASETRGSDNNEVKAEKLCEDGSCEPHIAMLHRLARYGYQDAQAVLGVMYISGDGVDKDVEHGVTLIQLAAKRGGAMAILALSKWHREGLYVEQDIVRANELLDKAVELNYPPAKYQKSLYLFASEDEQSIHEANELLEAAARWGSPPAMFLLARMKLLGEWVEYDLAGASNLLARLSREGHEGARALSRQLITQIEQEAQENATIDKETLEVAERLERFTNIERIRVTPLSFGRTHSAVSDITFEMDRTFNRGSLSRIRTQPCSFAMGCVSVQPSNRHGSIVDMLSDPTQ